MDLLVGIVSLVVLLFIIEAWVNGRIPAALARATAERIDERLKDPANPANTRLDRLDRRTDEIGARLEGLDRRMGDLDARLEGLDRRMDGLDTRLDSLDTRLSELDTRLDRVDAQVAVLNAQTSQQISALDRRVRERLRGLGRRATAPETATGGDPPGTS